tara:strand:+ start:220 stop:585 length:366 start_codon:yes stop_codon:yes gene_type:complete
MNKKNIFQESIDLQLKAREIGLDWLEVSGVIQKLKEETEEVIEAINLEDKMAMREEIGDLLFTVLCLSRHLDISPDEILDSANKKFNTRYIRVFNYLKKQGKDYANPKEMEEIWQIIKKET